MFGQKENAIPNHFFFLLRSTISSAWQNSKTQTLGRAVDNILTREHKTTNLIFSNIYINIEQLIQEHHEKIAPPGW